MEDIQIQCDPEVKGWNGEPDPRKTFFKQADFGFLVEKRRTVKKYCQPLRKDGSELSLRIVNPKKAGAKHMTHSKSKALARL